MWLGDCCGVIRAFALYISIGQVWQNYTRTNAYLWYKWYCWVSWLFSANVHWEEFADRVRIQAGDCWFSRMVICVCGYWCWIGLFRRRCTYEGCAVPSLNFFLHELMHLGLTLVHFGPVDVRSLYHLDHYESGGHEQYIFRSGAEDQVVPHAYGSDISWVCLLLWML